MKESGYKLLVVGIALFFMGLSMPLKAQEVEDCVIEKIYTQTDRPFYFPGETIWFKSYVVGMDNTISTLSDIMYAELISPQGSTVKTIKLSIHQGYAYGDFTIDKDWVGGIYSIRTFTNWMHNYEKEAVFTKKITVQKIVKPNVLLSLEFEKEGYGKSSWVTANFDIKDLKNNPISNTDVTYKVSVKGNVIQSKNILTNIEGKANIRFQLPDNLASRDVVLIVQIPHKGTTESISKSVPVVLNTIDLQFFPESGKLLEGIKSQVAFKAIDEFGKPVAVEGNIINNSGTVVTSFASFHDGMGSFYLTPVTNQKYYAEIKAPFTSEERISFPKIYKDGVNFAVSSDSLVTKLHVHSTLTKPLYLEVSNACKILLKQTIKSGQDIIDIDTQKFPIGITTFSITDKNQNPLAERLVFINAHKQLTIDVQLDKEIYQTREKVKVAIFTKDKDNCPVPSNLSIAIADNKLLSFANDKQDHILSYLLLSSELKGSIYKPSFYFNPKEKKSYQAIDYVMLTHGWRNYMLKPIPIEEAQYKPEQLATQSGKVVDRKGNPVAATLLLFDEQGNKVLVFKSDSNGDFSFKFDKSHRLTLIAYAEDGRKLEIVEHTKTNGFFNTIAVETTKEASIEGKYLPSKFNNPVKQSVKKEATASVALSADSSNLEEIMVLGYGTSKKKLVSTSIVKIETHEIESNESIAQLLQGQIAGVTIVNGNRIHGSGASISIRGANSISGNNQPLTVIDGVPYATNVLSKLNGNEVSSVTVLKNAAATSLYGSAAANGVIMVTTKNQNFNNNRGKKKLNNAKYNNYTIRTFYNYGPSGLYRAKQFYAPVYQGEKLSTERNDFRQTIYWNPVVQTDENGKAEIEFYNSDAITSFQIIAEGLGYNGLVGRQKKVYATKKLLNVDFKAPNYMVLNDTITLPVTITNETTQKIATKLTVELPEHLKLLEPFTENITIEANSSVVQQVKVIPIKKAEKVHIALALESDEFSDTIKREATILSPYFPTRVSVSGVKSQSFQFSIDNMVKGSLKANFALYTDIIGDVMDGIEGIIREPYGCFEQVSSSTYPNILVLKYLKETNKSNPEIEKKALDFIKKGYKKLAAYETAQDGFEWYGDTPPHEALTAYGLMEFTEMKEVYEGVSEPMLQRTIKYLLSRKNGKGGFKQNRGKYGFSAAPENVNNAYIVYAISESGVEVDIEEEYNHTYNEALKSNDTYRMALMACASFNMGRLENAALLLTNIKKNIENYGFSDLPVDNTITRSYGNAKNIETAAFSLLALMKKQNYDTFLVTQGIDYLVSMRKHNRFGSTQSTSMALKALVVYTRSQKTKMITKNDFVTLTLNGKVLNKQLNSSKNGKIVIDNIASYIIEGNQNLQVQFSNPEITFPYSLNITYDSFLPNSAKDASLALKTTIADKDYKVGDNVSMTIDVINKKNEHLGMVTSIIGVPSGTTPQPWQLKELVEQNKVAYYEIFDNYLVFYWRSFKALETNTIRLDLKADIAGSYQSPASTAYLYYGDEFKTWISGNKLEIKN
ncbi:TonB-dependent receptor plug domain-containing protein [Aquimarina sp. 2201CG1-2-11]|uniref:TonB-dependent receptor plug domain-containing protein n=1 Tax=Aquimarina discodermiae TaxID=3231043 RepID=UPI003461C1D0